MYSIEINKDLVIRTAEENDTKLILQFIRDLAVYEKLLNEVTATEEQLKNYLFGERPAAEILIAYYKDEPAGFALFFQNFSTFLGKPGLYLEDLFVKPQLRGKNIGKALLVTLAKIARDRNYGRFEWSVLDWNEPSIKFYKNLGAKPMDEWTIFRVTGEDLQKLADTRLTC